MNSSYLPHTRFSHDQPNSRQIRQTFILDMANPYVDYCSNVILRYGFNLGSIELEASGTSIPPVF